MQFTAAVGAQRTDTVPDELVFNASAPPILSRDPTKSSPKSADLNITQPVYSRRPHRGATGQAEKNVEAERARLVATEQTVFLTRHPAYLDVVRDQADGRARINNEQVLRRQLEATNDSFRVGEMTRTDVAQAEARLAGATATRQQAEGNLQVSRAELRARRRPCRRRAWRSRNRTRCCRRPRDAALSLAATNNPNVIAAQFNEAPRATPIDVARGQLLPQLSLVGDLNAPATAARDRHSRRPAARSSPA